MTEPQVTATAGPSFSDLAELVRLPAVASVPGDALAGAAFACGDRGLPARAYSLPLSSSLIYLAGMALNDYADRNVDAAERPHRPIPSGRVTPQQAAQLAHVLAAAGIAVAALNGRRALGIAVPLATTVYAYDLVLKNTAAGPAAMAACRVLDVLLGATAGQMRYAVPAATAVGAHTLLLTTVSRREVEGATTDFARKATIAAGIVAGVATLAVLFGSRRRRLDGFVPLTAYTATQIRSGLAAVADPSPKTLQQMVGSGVLALIPLQSALLIATGHRRLGSLIGSLWPMAQRLAKRRAVT